MDKQSLQLALERIANSLEQLTNGASDAVELNSAPAYIWMASEKRLLPIKQVQAIALDLLLDLNQNAEVLLANTQRFARGLPANNALLWGSRGMGKSSFVKAIFKAIDQDYPGAIALVEVHRDDLKSLPDLLMQLRASQRRFILFCDDLSFDETGETYKSLKVLLDGSVAGQPDNVIMYATSNRRHLVSESMTNNLAVTDAIHPNDLIEETVSLSDRFGLWLGFYNCSEADYLNIVQRYVLAYQLDIDQDTLYKDAKQWALTRGNWSGRVAWQYITDLAGRKGKKIG